MFTTRFWLFGRTTSKVLCLINLKLNEAAIRQHREYVETGQNKKEKHKSRMKAKEDKVRRVYLFCLSLLLSMMFMVVVVVVGGGGGGCWSNAVDIVMPGRRAVRARLLRLKGGTRAMLCTSIARVFDSTPFAVRLGYDCTLNHAGGEGVG